MSHIIAPGTLDMIGFVIGVLGVSIVVVLLLISPKQYDPRRLLVMLTVGAALMLMNFDPWLTETHHFELMRAVSYIVLVAVFAWEARNLYHSGIALPNGRTVGNKHN